MRKNAGLKMDNILAEICAQKRLDVEAAKQAASLHDLYAKCADLPPTRGFLTALKQKALEKKYSIIAEIKQQSPSGGVLRHPFDVGAIATAYHKAGAACLSVLTDTPYFGGALTDLAIARAACPLPILRKDFMIDVYQVAQARLYGADAILIIMAAVDDALAATLLLEAKKWGLDALIEVHDADEMRRALELKPELVGINNRNLKTLKTDLNTTPALASIVPDTIFLVSESGIKTSKDIQMLVSDQVQGFLVGESLLIQEDPGTALELLYA
jgi:indole-3-glycerol phosphate synthase